MTASEIHIPEYCFSLVGRPHVIEDDDDKDHSEDDVHACMREKSLNRLTTNDDNERGRRR